MITYREQDVANIKEHQDQIAHGVVVVPVRADNQRNGDEVVGQHLPVVLATLLDVDHKDLLEPETELREDVELVQRAELTVWPESPEIPEVQPRWRGVIQILKSSLQVSN